MITEEVSRLPEGTAGPLRLLRRAVQHREEVQADQVHDALLLGERALAPELVAEHAGRGQLGREPGLRRRTAPGDGTRGEQVAGFQGSAHGAKAAQTGSVLSHVGPPAVRTSRASLV